MIKDDGLITEANLANIETMTNNDITEQTFPCSKSTIEALEKGVKYVQNITIKTWEHRQWRYSGVFIINFEHISQQFLAFLPLTLNN